MVKGFTYDDERFDWDDAKAAANLTKHGVSFEEAVEVFSDYLYTTTEDLTAAENRFQTVGATKDLTILVVVYTERAGSIRIISARKATKAEIRKYEKENDSW